MDNKAHEYELVSADDTVLGTVWWDAAKSTIDGSDEGLLSYVKEHSYQGITYHSGIDFLTHLGRMFKNGYVYARRVDQ